MSSYTPTNCDDDLVDNVNSACPVRENGDVNAMGYIKKGYEALIDPTDPTEWETLFCDRNAYRFNFARGTVALSENLVDGFGGLEQEVESYTYTLSVEVQDYKANADHLIGISKQKNWVPFYVTEGCVHIGTKSSPIIVKNDVAGKQEINWSITCIWKELVPLKPYDRPVGTFSGGKLIAP